MEDLIHEPGELLASWEVSSISIFEIKKARKKNEQIQVN